MAGRYFGGQYDSVKQAAYLEYILKNEQYAGKLPYQVILDQYTARIRLDMLLGGYVIVTDAMFYDGVFFQTLFLHRETRDDFINFLRMLAIGGTPPLLEIRQRESSVQNTLSKMLIKRGKPNGFVFSSIGRNYIKDSVATVLAKTQNDGNEYNSWDAFLNASISFAESDVIKEEIKQKIEIIKYMEGIPSNILQVWDGEYNFNKVLEDAKEQERFKLQRTGDVVIDDVIKTIEKEVEKPFPDRSKVQNEIATKTEIFARPPKTLAESVLEQLWGQFLQVYNRTIGIQHHCDTFDIGEIFINDDKIDMVISDNLSQATLQALASERWMEFGRTFNKLSKYRNKWLYEVWELEDRRKNSYKDARLALDELVKEILREYKIMPTFQDVINLVGGGASIDVDLMKPSGLSFGVKTKIIKIPIQTFDLVRKQWIYRKDRLNMIEYGQKFMRGL